MSWSTKQRGALRTISRPDCRTNPSDGRYNRKRMRAVASHRRWRILTETVAKVVSVPRGSDTTAAAGLLPRLAVTNGGQPQPPHRACCLRAHRETGTKGIKKGRITRKRPKGDQQENDRRRERVEKNEPARKSDDSVRYNALLWKRNVREVE